MAQGFIPGVHRHWERSSRPFEESRLPDRGAAIPGPLVIREATPEFDALCERIMSSRNWLNTHEYVVRVFGIHSLGLGVVYGVGENLVASVLEAFDLARVFVLADLRDALKGTSPLAMQIMRYGPLWSTRQLLAHAANWHFESELQRAHRDREDLIQALWEIIAHPIDALNAIKDDYVRKWNEFRTLHAQDSLLSQFEAGHILGGLLLDLISLIAGGVGIAKGLVTAFPKLIKSVQTLERVGRGMVRERQLKAPKSTAKNATDSPPTTVQKPLDAKTSIGQGSRKLLPPPVITPRIEYGKTGPSKWERRVPSQKVREKKTPQGEQKQPDGKTKKAGKLLKTKRMKAYYIGEEIAGNPKSWSWREARSAVTYLSDVEREAHRLTIRDGKLYNAKGALFDTWEATTWDGVDRAIFVMDERGSIFTSLEQKRFEFHHSSLASGKPVAIAGELEVHDGVLQYISNNSGHYEPSDEFLDQAVDHLKSEGIDFSFVDVYSVKKGLRK